MDCGLSKIVIKGNRRDSLAAIRDRLAATLDEAEDPREVAALSKELRAVIAELDKIPGAGEVTAVDRLVDQVADDLAAARARRAAR